MKNRSYLSENVGGLALKCETSKLIVIREIKEVIVMDLHMSESKFLKLDQIGLVTWLFEVETEIDNTVVKKGSVSSKMCNKGTCCNLYNMDCF